MELSKDLDLHSWKKSTGASCYSNKAPSQMCMISANGETLCAPMNGSGFLDGAAAILGKTVSNCLSSPAMNFIEPFDQTSSMMRCIDGSLSENCIKK